MEKAFNNKGFTMVELLIIIGIVGILVSIALPSFTDMLSRSSANSAARSVASTVNLARSEAVKRGRDVAICSSTNNTTCVPLSWNSGWIVYDFTSGQVIKAYQPLANMNLTFSGGNVLRYNSRGFGQNGGVVNFDICPDNNDMGNARRIAIGISGRARLVEGVGCP